MGGGKKGDKSTPAADAQARMAEQLFRQTDPIRTSLIGRSASFLGAQPVASTQPFEPTASGKAGIIQRAQANGTVPQVSGGGGFGDVMATPTFQAFKESADQNFSRARDNALATLPTGGALAESLVGLEGQRASTLTQGAGAIYGDELARAMSLASGGSAQSMNSLGQAAAVQAQMAANRAMVQASKYESLGQGAGAMAGGK